MKVNSATLSTDKFDTSSPYALKVGLFGIGLGAYWGQFDGLQARLEGQPVSLPDWCPSVCQQLE